VRSRGGCGATSRFATSRGDGPVADFRTVTRFRLRHREDFAWVLRETVRRARAAGLGQLGLVTIDGTKVRANTSRHKAMSHGRMVAEEARLERECAAIVARMEEVNAAEDSEHGEDDDGRGGLPAERQSRERRRATRRAVGAQLEPEKGEKLEPRHEKSFADPDAQMMRTGDGALTYAYNAQAAVSEDGLVVASGLTTEVRDTGQLGPMIQAVEANTGAPPGVAVADKGYLTEHNLATLRGAALSNRRRARGAAASAVATGTGDATDASAPAAAVGAGPVRAAQDAGGAPARRDQGRDGLAALHAARGGEGARGVGSRVRGLQPAAAARNRSRLRLTRAGEAAPPARGAEERSGEAGAPSERL